MGYLASLTKQVAGLNDVSRDRSPHPLSYPHYLFICPHCDSRLSPEQPSDRAVSLMQRSNSRLLQLTDKFALIYGRTEDKPGAGPALMGMNIGMGGGSGAGKKGGQRTRRGGR
jgi:hypothetical protein